MDPDKAVKFVDRMFKRYALPKYQKVNQQRPLDEEELDRLRLQFAARMFDIPYDQKTELKDPEVKHGVLEKAAQTVSATGAGVIGGIKTIAELKDKLEKHLPIVGDYIHKQNVESIKRMGEAEGRAYGEAKEVAPTGASVGAAIGHQLPATIATHGVESMLPALGAGASKGAKVLSGAGRGAAGGATFEASRPGGDPKSGAMWGGVLGAAFPMLGKMFGLGRRSVSAGAPEAAKAVEDAGTTAKAASSMGDIADIAAKKKFGKVFKDLTGPEKTQMPAAMKEEIKSQQAVKQATKKAEVAAAKAGREAEETAKRAEKAKASTEKAAKQAQRRSAVPTTTPVQKQAVAAKAAEENPSIGKTLGQIEKREGPGTPPTGVAERRRDILAEQRRLVTYLTDRMKGASEEEKKILQMQIDEYKGLEGASRIAEGGGGEEMAEQIRKAKEREGSTPIVKVPEGETGPKIRAKEGKPASPAQQAADRERIAAKRELSKKEEFGSALEKHAQELAGKYTPGSLNMMHIPELEEAMKDFPHGESYLRGFQKLRKQGRLSDELYFHEMKNWLESQFGAQE